MLRAVNPATGELVAEHPEHDDAAVDRRIAAAQRAFRDWRDLGLDARAKPMRAVARLLRERAAALAATMAAEMGKPVSDGKKEVEKCAWVCEHYADQAAAYLAPETIVTDARKSFVTYRPLGVVLAVMPWNYPFWQVFRFAAPGLMAGNAGLLKHAANVPGCAIALESLFTDAGFPDGLFANLLISSKRVDAVIADPRVAAVTLTGSVSAGKSVAAKAGSVVKKTVLELGGSDAYVILADADLDAAADICGESRLLNAGQSCISAKRFIPVREVRDAFVDKLVARMRRVRPGDPTDEATAMGPLARTDLRDELHDQVKRSVAAGARVLLGGEVPDGPGAWYPPTVLVDVRPGQPAHDEELFGPVAAVIDARDEADALRIANDSRFGLGGALFTRDVARGEELAVTRLDAGSVFVNAMVRSDPRLPFGGIKESGYGRELGAPGIREFTNVKTVYSG